MGIERWSNELSDPFGTDICDLPIMELTKDAIDEIWDNLRIFRESAGSRALIRVDRKGLEGIMT